MVLDISFITYVYLLIFLIVGIPVWLLFSNFSFVCTIWKNWKYSSRKMERRICSFFKEEGIFYKKEDGRLLMKYHNVWCNIRILSSREIKSCVVSVGVNAEVFPACSDYAKICLLKIVNEDIYLSKVYIENDVWVINVIWDVIGTNLQDSFSTIINQIGNIVSKIEEQIKLISEQEQEKTTDIQEEDILQHKVAGEC